MEGVVVQVDIDEVKRHVSLQGKTGRFHQRVSRFDDQVDGLGRLFRRFPFQKRSGTHLIAYHRCLRQPADRSSNGHFQSRRKLYGYAVWIDHPDRLPHQVGELHPVVEDREGVDVAELFEVEPVGHG